MFFVPPSKEYFSYIDFRVLCLLFCLMAVIAGFNKTGVFLLLSKKLLHKVSTTRSLCYVLIMLCFFTSMWITNDVALITFVPFTILLLAMTGQSKHLIYVIVLQTIAANLGSILTPIGNPQNLYLYSYYKVPIIEFFRITLPITLISFVLLSSTVLLIKKETLIFTQPRNEKINTVHWFNIGFYSILFLFCLCSVLHLIDYRTTLIIVILCTLVFDRNTLKSVDYSLLLTFLCFFIFVGNIGNITMIQDYLANLIKARELLVSIILSQGISNVPAAVLLSTFTKDYKALILGTNLGGLGTLVASLASLISYKFYCKTKDAKPLKYLCIFTLYNFILLALLCVFVLITT